MATELQAPFRWMGTRVRVATRPEAAQPRRGAERRLTAESAREVLDTLRVDIRRDEGGEYFDVACDRRVVLEVVDARRTTGTCS